MSDCDCDSDAVGVARSANQSSVLQLSRQLLPPPGGQSVPTVVTALAFDVTQELLWAGNGYVCQDDWNVWMSART